MYYYYFDAVTVIHFIFIQIDDKINVSLRQMMKCKCPIDVMKITTVIRIMRVFMCVDEVNKLTA